MAEHKENANIEVRLVSQEYVARDTHVFAFAPINGQHLPQSDAGSHIDLLLPNGIVRQYSLINPAATSRRYMLCIKRDPASRGGSSFIFDKLRVGETLSLSAPRNNFSLCLDASHSVLIAGGIGITPIWAMIQFLSAKGLSWELHYACRSRHDAAFLQDLQLYKEARFHFDNEASGQFMNLSTIVEGGAVGTHFYCCGPAPMLGAFKNATQGVAPNLVHIESFSALDAPVLSGEYVVELARSKKRLEVPAGSTILDVLRENDVTVASSCEEGVCGVCETEVLSGVPDHRGLRSHRSRTSE
jgi:tetrachlorobenzoquinone reductase